MTHANHQGEPGDTGTGWVLVPREPTEEMIHAGWIDKEDVDPDDIYRAMIEAAPIANGANSQVGDGWVSVPQEPTEAMERAFEAAYWAKSGDISSPTPTEHPEDGGGPFGYGYRALIASAPNPPDRVGEEVGQASRLWGKTYDQIASEILTASRTGEATALVARLIADARAFERDALASARSHDPAGAGGDLGELERLSVQQVRQIVREAMAKHWDDEGAPHTAALVRAGKWDDVDPVRPAIEGGMAVARELNARSGKLVASTGSGEETKGATPMGSGHSRAEPFRLGASPECPSRGWQPISTAPRDGKGILLCVAGYEPCTGMWIGDWSSLKHGNCWASFNVEGKFKSDAELDEYLSETTFEPDFWQSLPAPPRVSDEHPAGEDARSAAEGEACQRGGVAETPEATPQQSPSPTTETDPLMSVEQARAFLVLLGQAQGVDPGFYAKLLRGRANSPDAYPHVAKEMLAQAEAIEAALRTLQAGGEVR